MFITGKKYHLGAKTFWFFFISHNKFLLSLFVLLTILSYHIRYGIFEEYVLAWLLQNYSYIEMSMIAMWLSMVLVSFFIVILLRTSVLYKQYSFILYKHALHVKHGIFFVKEHVMPYHQIMNVEILRPYFYALLGLVQLDIITGQADETESTGLKHSKHPKKKSLLPVIDKHIAQELSHELMRRSVGEHNSATDKESISKPRRRRR